MVNQQNCHWIMPKQLSLKSKIDKLFLYINIYLTSRSRPLYENQFDKCLPRINLSKQLRNGKRRCWLDVSCLPLGSQTKEGWQRPTLIWHGGLNPFHIFRDSSQILNSKRTWGFNTPHIVMETGFNNCISGLAENNTCKIIICIIDFSQTKCNQPVKVICLRQNICCVFKLSS